MRGLSTAVHVFVPGCLRSRVGDSRTGLRAITLPRIPLHGAPRSQSGREVVIASAWSFFVRTVCGLALNHVTRTVWRGRHLRGDAPGKAAEFARDGHDDVVMRQVARSKLRRRAYRSSQAMRVTASGNSAGRFGNDRADARRVPTEIGLLDQHAPRGALGGLCSRRHCAGAGTSQGTRPKFAVSRRPRRSGGTPGSRPRA